MKKASQLFSQEQKQQIQTAVAMAENTTSGEIIPVVATKSGQYDRAEDIFGLLFSIAMLSVCWVLYEQFIPVSQVWGDSVTNQLPLYLIIPILLFGFLLGTKLAVLFPSLALVFIAKQLMQENVERNAIEAFHHFQLAETKDATGILIYVSLYEHMITLFGDSGINTKIESKVWEELCSHAIVDIKKGDPAEGLVKTIEQCGEILTQHFPILPDDENELENELQLID